MTAVCNASNLMPQAGGLTFPPSTRFELADILKPKSEGGLLETQGVTEVVSSLYRDGTDVPHDVAMGNYVVITSESAYARRRFSEYNTLPDKSGTYVSLYRPTHTIGLELGVSVASVALRKEPTGASRVCNSDVVRRSPSVHSNPARRLMVRVASQCGIGRCRRRHRTQPKHCRWSLRNATGCSAMSPKARCSPTMTSCWTRKILLSPPAPRSSNNSDQQADERPIHRPSARCARAARITS